MEKDITTSPDFCFHFEESFWTKRNAHGNKPLTIHHVLPSFILLGFGLISSIIIFILEFLPCFKKKRIHAEPIQETHVPDKSNVMAEDKNDTIMVTMAEIQESISKNE